MTEQSNEQSSRLQEYQKRLEELMESAREGIDRQAPEVLDKMAATARNLAQRFQDMARDARQRAADKEATPESAGTAADPAQGTKPPGEPHPDEARGDGKTLP
jgi:hypothetical protein